MRIIVLFIFFISIGAQSYDASNIYFFSPYYERNHIPVLLEDSADYSHVILTNKSIIQLVNSQHLLIQCTQQMNHFYMPVSKLL